MKERGFALMDVLLAVILCITLTGGIFALLRSYGDKTEIQTVENDIMRINQAYSPIVNQTAVVSAYPLMCSSGSQISTWFLKSVPIQDSRIGAITYISGIADSPIPYSYLLTDLNVNNKSTAVGFETFSTASSYVTNTSPKIQYFIAGLIVSYNQARQLIQDLNNTFSIFLGVADTNTTFSAATYVTGLPPAPTNSNATYNIYFVSPTLTKSNTLDGTFTPPALGTQ